MWSNRAISREVVGIVLGGGRGTRLRPLTDNTNKHLLPIAGTPMITRCINQLLEANIKDIVVLIDQKYASQFMDALQDGRSLGARSLCYAWQPLNGAGLPTAIAHAAPHTKGRRIVVACGDVLIEKGISGPVQDFLAQPRGARMVTAFSADSAGYSPLKTLDDRVVDILPKDQSRHVPAMIDLGVYMYTPEVFDRIPRLLPSARGETEIWDLNLSYAAEGELRFSQIDGWWSDTGSDLKTYCEADTHYANR